MSGSDGVLYLVLTNDMVFVCISLYNKLHTHDKATKWAWCTCLCKARAKLANCSICEMRMAASVSTGTLHLMLAAGSVHSTVISKCGTELQANVHERVKHPQFASQDTSTCCIAASTTCSS